MQITVTNPKVEKLILEQVDEGRFPSIEEFVSAAVVRFVQDETGADSDAEIIAAIREADQQTARGEGTPLEEAAELLRQRYAR